MVTITSRKIIDTLRSGTDVSWSLFAIGEPLQIEIEFEVFTYKTFTTNSPLKLTDATTLNNYALANSSSKLAGLNVGDSIRVVDAGASIDVTCNVTNVISSNLVITDYDFSGVAGSYAGAEIYNLTAITGVSMPYNFIENNEQINYLSKIDGSYQKLVASGLDASNTTPVAMSFDGNLDYQIGSATIEGVSWDTSNGRQKFKIIHNTYATPYFISTQITDLTNNIAPSYFQQNKCLKHIYQIEAYGQLTNPNSGQIGLCPTEIGNSGWFNEVFNGGISTYTIQNVQIKDVSNNVIPKLVNSTDIQYIEFDFVSNGEWVTGQSMLFGFGKLPNNQSEYQNVGLGVEKNFLFTNTAIGANSTPVATSLSGGTYQVISQVTANYVDANTIKFVVEIQMDVDAVNIFDRSINPQFMFWVTSSNSTYTTAATQNKQSIKSNVYTLASNNVSGVVQFTKTFLRHYENVGDTGITGPVDAFKNDECVMYSSCFLQPLSYTLPTTYNTIKSQIIAKKSDGTEFVIEDFTITPSQLFSGANQLVGYSSNRVFQIPTTEPRKQFNISNCYADGDKIRFDITHGFMFRWEDWVQLIGASTDFYDSNEPQNGLNQDWFRYQNADWAVYHRVECNVTYGIAPMTYTQDTLIVINDYESNTDFTTKDVETFTMAGASLYDSGNSRWYIQSNANTQVKATFVKNVPLNINLCYVVFGIEIFEQGGIGGRQRYSSKWATSTPLTCFIPLTGVSGNKVELSQPTTDTIIAKAVIDYTLLPQGNIIYTIVARLYENDGSAGNKITEDGIDKFTEDDQQKIIE